MTMRAYRCAAGQRGRGAIARLADQAAEAIERLQGVYRGSMRYEVAHVTDPAERARKRP